MNRFLILFLLILFSGGLYAQDIKIDLQKIKDKYEAKEFTAGIVYTFYSGKEKIEETKATYIFSKGNYYFKIGDIEVVKNEKCQLITNHLFQTISVLPSEKDNNYRELAKIPVDTALKDVTSYKYASISETEGSYTVALKKGKYSRVEIYYNKSSYELSKVKLHISEAYVAIDPDMSGGIFIVEYKSFTPSISSADRKLLSEKSFVSIKSKSVALAPAYKKYELNNYLNF